MPWWYPFGCIAFIVGGILIFLKPEWLWALTEQWKSYAADGPSDFYILNTKIGGVLFAAAMRMLFCVCYAFLVVTPYRLFQVARPSMPSGFRSCTTCQARTASRVLAP